MMFSSEITLMDISFLWTLHEDNQVEGSNVDRMVNRQL